MATPTIEELFEDAVQLSPEPVPLEDSVGGQPDDVLSVGELTGVSDPPAEARLADSQTALVFVPDNADDTEQEVTAFVFFMIPVFVFVVAGGSPGTAGATANFTYNVTDLNGDQLGTPGQAPLKRRHIGRMIAPPPGATGTGFNLEDGTFVLFDANEVIDTRVCP